MTQLQAMNTCDALLVLNMSATSTAVTLSLMAGERSFYQVPAYHAHAMTYRCSACKCFASNAFFRKALPPGDIALTYNNIAHSLTLSVATLYSLFLVRNGSGCSPVLVRDDYSSFVGPGKSVSQWA